MQGGEPANNFLGRSGILRFDGKRLGACGERLRVALHSTKWIFRGGAGGETGKFYPGTCPACRDFFVHVGSFFARFFGSFFVLFFCSLLSRFGVLCWVVLGAKIATKFDVLFVAFSC